MQEELDLLKFQVETLYPPLPEEICSVLGTVTEIGDKFLVMEAQIRVSQFPLPEGKEFERRNIRVNVAEEIEIFQLEILEPSLLEEPSKKMSLGLKDIKIGDYIMQVPKKTSGIKKKLLPKRFKL